MTVTIQQGIDATALKLAIRQTVIAAAEAQAEAIRRLHGDRAALAAKFGIRYDEHAGPAQGSLFGGEE